MDKGAAKEKILIYGVQPGSKRESQLKTALGFLGIPGIFLGKASLCQKVGYLAGLKGYERSEDQEMEAVERELMILSGISPARLDQISGFMRRMKLPPVKLKAMITPTNVEWTLFELLHEVQGEERMMGLYHKLQSAVQKGIADEAIRARAQAMLEGDEAPDLKEIQSLMDEIEARKKR